MPNESIGSGIAYNKTQSIQRDVQQYGARRERSCAPMRLRNFDRFEMAKGDTGVQNSQQVAKGHPRSIESVGKTSLSQSSNNSRVGENISQFYNVGVNIVKVHSHNASIDNKPKSGIGNPLFGGSELVVSPIRYRHHDARGGN